ncbi:MAG: type IV pilus secretin PilQ [bacterium]
MNLDTILGWSKMLQCQAGNKTKLLLIGVFFAFWQSQAIAQNALKDLAVAAKPGGQVEIRLTFEGLPVEPNVFTTAAPARIALDFSNTENKLVQRSVNVGVGATKRVTVVEAGGRTRAVIELFESSPYQTRIEGNDLIVSVGDNATLGEAVTSQPADVNEAVGINNIDFRRGKNGQGKVIVSFDDSGVNVDFNESPGQIKLQVYNIEIPENLERNLDVVDFATPVTSIDTNKRGENVEIVVQVSGKYEKLAYQSGNQYILEIKEPVEVDNLEKAVSLSEKTYEGDRVTFNFQDVSVRALLQLIADFSDLNIVVADSVEGNVTLRLINVPWDQALDIVLSAKSLDKRKNGNVIWVAPAEEIAGREQQQLQALQDKRQLEPLLTDYIQVNYADASDLAALFVVSATKISVGSGGTVNGTDVEDDKILSQRGSVAVDKRTNTIIVNDTAEGIRRARAMVARLDHPVQQVEIESRIVVASNNFQKELGARFGVTSSVAKQGGLYSTAGNLEALDRMTNSAIRNRVSDPNSNGFPNIDTLSGPGQQLPGAPLDERLNVNLPVNEAAGAFSLSILAADYLLDLELSALEAEGKGEVVSSPRVVTANQQLASIKQGQEIAYQTVGQNGQVSIQYKEVVLELNVTPLITPDQRIVMDLEVKNDNVSGFIAGAFGSQVPIIDKRSVKTKLLVDSGQTVVLGGIYERETLEDVTKVPFLGDVPGIGALFRKKTRTQDKSELLIFVTPTILTDNLGVE